MDNRGCNSDRLQTQCLQIEKSNIFTTYVLHFAFCELSFPYTEYHSGCGFQVLNNVLENDRMIHEYESLTSDLLKWIEEIIQILNEREFENSLQGVQAQLSQFNSYRTQEKPPK